MELTQSAILALLLEEGGKLRNSVLLEKFKGALNCADPVEKKENRDLFKRFVNNIAVVKEIDNCKYIVVRKKYDHLLNDNQCVKHYEENENDAQDCEKTPMPTREEVYTVQEQITTVDKNNGNSSINEPQPTTEYSISQALEKATYTDFKIKRSMNFDIVQRFEAQGKKASEETAYVNKTSRPTTAYNKPYALPLRMPPSATRVEIHKLKGDTNDPGRASLGSDNSAVSAFSEDAGYSKSRHLLVESRPTTPRSSPRLGRAAKTTKPSEEPMIPPMPMFPLEQSEHEWMVKSAAGQWSQAHGLLLKDNRLAEKRDFMSGFTALHWAAKCGNSIMLAKMIEIARHGGIDININAKTFGGYTPLHIAALHGQEFILNMLVADYGADPRVRDNCGKRAYHYLHKGISNKVRALLGEPSARQDQDNSSQAPHDREELDHVSGRHTISRLFQPHMTGYKKKVKQRPACYSLSEEPSREEESRPRHKVLSDIFK